MMKKLLILLCCICLVGIAGAQNNPGYLGRHVLFNMEGSLSPSWKNPNPMTEALNAHFESEHTKRYLGLNYFLSPNVEAIVWGKGTLGVGYNYYNTPIGGMLTRYFEHDDSPYLENYTFTGKMVAHGFNVFYKQYIGDTKAPMGYYFKFTFDGFFYNYACNEPLSDLLQHWDEVPEEESAQYGYVRIGKDGKGSIFGLKAEFGYDYLFFNRFRLSMGLTFGSTFGGYKWLKQTSEASLFYNDNTEYLSVNDNVRNRILNAYWFGIKLGIGVLAF